MWKCPICSNQEKSKYVCKKCGYDNRKDFIQWRTVSKVSREDVRDWVKLKNNVENGEVPEELEKQKQNLADKRHKVIPIIGLAVVFLFVVFYIFSFFSANKNMIQSAHDWYLSSSMDPSIIGSDIKCSDIRKITFLDSLENVPDDAWDVSERQDGSVMAWVESGNQLYFAADGPVKANPDSGYFFGRYVNVEEIDFNQAFDTDGVTDMTGMFSYCESLQTLNWDDFNTEHVTSMSDMFSGCHALQSLNLSEFNTSKVTDMSSMFAGCMNLSDLDLSSFDTSQVTDMALMFYNCDACTSMSLQEFNTQNTRSMAYMFAECDLLKEINLYSFDTSNVTDMRAMFMNCPVLSVLNVDHFDMTNVQSTDKMFVGCDSLLPEIYEGIWDGN